jgi:hypothetical protein
MPQGKDEIGPAALGVGATENVAATNRLSSVRVVRQNVDDQEEEYARFCFRQRVQRLDQAKAASFAVIGPDPTLSLSATDVTLDHAHAECVIAGFTAGTDLRSFTLGAVEGGVVANRDGEKNIADSAPLGGAESANRSATVGPDLTGVRISRSLNRIEYHFDEDLGPDDGVDARAFGLITRRGDAATGSRVVSVHGKVVTVQFDDILKVVVARRWFVRPGAVHDTGGSANPAGAVGGRTGLPDLVGVSRSPADTEYNYTFDDNLSGGVDGGDFVLYTDDGTAIAGDAAAVDGRTVHVTFPRAIEDYDAAHIVLAAVDDGAGTATDGGHGAAITPGVTALGSHRTRPGHTTGPDLLRIAPHPGDQLMTLTFDERVDDEDDDHTGSGHISIVTGDHRLVKAGRILQIEGRKVYVQAGKGLLDSLVGVTLAPGAIQDPEGNGNPLATTVHGRAGRLRTSGPLYGRPTTG